MAQYRSSYDPDFEGLPAVGETWEWGYTQPQFVDGPFGQTRNYNRHMVRVTEVKWNGEEWWVRSKGYSGEYWTDVSVFVESARKVDTQPKR